MIRTGGLLAIALAALGCGDNTSGEDALGGANATVYDRGARALTHPIPTLNAAQLETHNLGHGPFAFHWTPPQLGPLFNHDACAACHLGNGRGKSEIGPSVFGSQALVRVSLPDGEPEVPGGPVPVPGLGLQLQDHATFGLAEVDVTLGWVEHAETLGDGTAVALRAPTIALARPNGDPLPEMLSSYRQAPPLIGLGLLAAIPEDDLVARADPDDADGDGISGRPNLVWDVEGARTVIGRFGHKANVGTLGEQVAAAFVNDMGLTNRLFREAPGEVRDVTDDQLREVTFHVATFGVPAAAARDDRAARGRDEFEALGCAACHTPTQFTGDSEIPQLRGQLIHPYTDLLLHDLGDGLADHRPDFAASGAEWRTAPLWGLGLVEVIAPGAGYLHDGRARTLTEAILWHGGEALPAREAFRAAPRDRRDALLAFLATL